MDALFAGVFAALVSFLLLSFILGFSNSRKESENPEDEILQQEMCLDGETERPTEPLLAGQRMELFPSTITTAELVSDEVEAIEEHTSPRDLEGEFQYEEPTRRKKFDGAKLLLKLTGVRWGVFAPFLVIMGLESPSPGSSWLSVLLVAALLVLVRDRGSLVAITSPHILLAPTRFRIGAFHRLVLPGVLAFVVVVLSAIVPLPARWSHFNVRASTYRLSESEPMTAMLRVGRESLYLTSGSEDSKEAPSVDDINEYVVATEIDDAYVIRQAATLVWNKYGVDGVSLAKTSSEPGTWKFSLSDDDRARVDSAASKGRVVPLAVGLMVFLTVIWVFPRSRKPESTDNGVITWLRRKVASLPVLVGLAVYAAFSATQEDTIRWILGLDLTPSGDIARSNWGYVHAFVNDHWTALIAISAALCAFLYWRALRGFLMTDITGASPVRWPWKRGEAGR